MAGIAQNQGFESLIIGGVRDHVHALLMLPPTLPLAEVVQFLKGSSSKWINETEGQFALAGRIRRLQRERLVRYIQNQRAHHEEESFDEEFVEFLKKYGVSNEPEHVLGWLCRPSGTWSNRLPAPER